MGTLKAFKADLRKCARLYLWCVWQREDGDYIEISKAGFLRGINADTPNDGAHGGRMDATPIDYRWEGCDIYVG